MLENANTNSTNTTISENNLSSDPKEKIKTEIVGLINSMNPNQDHELDAAIDTSLVALPLEQAESEILNKIIEAPTKAELQAQFELFNINQSKKNALRVIKLNNLLDKVEDQAIERFTKRPDQVSNRELLDYMSVVSTQIDRAQRSVDAVSIDTSPIKITNQKNEVNINVGPQLDRDSKERVIDAITALLKQAKTPPDSAKLVDAEVREIPNNPEISETPANDTMDINKDMESMEITGDPISEE